MKGSASITNSENKKRIVEHPIDAYADFHSRIKKQGQMAPFPEFMPVIDFLLKELESEYTQKIIADNPVLLLELKEIRTFLFHINLSFEVEQGIVYPYPVPFDQPFPYRPTIDAIESAVRFFDKVNRLDPDNKAVKLYHFDRYCYHRHALVANPDIILFPTTEELSLTDFIRTRSVPISFVGVVSRTTRVDGHYQSPLDFWYHDLNHARRLYAYIKMRLATLGYHTEEEVARYLQSVNDFITTVVLPEFITIDSAMSEEEEEIRKMATMIIFEIVHETALTLDRESLIADLLRPNGPQPFEVMRVEDLNEVEEFRTPTGNLQSGASFADLTDTSPTRVNYFLDKTSIGLLANVFSKLNHSYYDEATQINEDIVSIPYRTPEFIAKTAWHILDRLQYSPMPSEEELLGLVTNRAGLKERILHTPLIPHESFLNQEATDPMKADEIITLVRGLDKKIFTLFGYSALGYEDIALLEKTVRQDLEGLSTDDYLISIGATEEGIGAMYKVAKEMGFKTIGIVSTQALSYSGKFSEYVDSIYIVNDDYWGGMVPGTTKVAETTKTFLGTSDVIFAYGGGMNTAVTLKLAKELGIKTAFKPFDMNHAMADKAAGKKQTDYKGEAYYVSMQ